MARLVNVKLERWMTKRDREIIVSVYYHGILNSRQVERLFFSDSINSRVIALRRLKKLTEGGFLKQHWYGYNRQGSMQHFTITNKGSIIVSSELDIDYTNIKVNDAGIISNIEHSSLIADFSINLLENKFEIIKYTSEKHNHISYIFGNKEVTFEPDAIGIIKSNSTGRIYPFFMEMDRGTMSYNYFKMKIPNYEGYYVSNAYLKEYNTFPLVFIITTDNTRIKRMSDIIENTRKTDINYLITTIEDSKNMKFNLIGTDRIITLK